MIFLWCLFICFWKCRLKAFIVLTLQKLSCTLLRTASTTETLARWRQSSWLLRVVHSASWAENCCFISSKSLFCSSVILACFLAWCYDHSASLFLCSARNSAYGSGALVTGLAWEWRHCLYKTLFTSYELYAIIDLQTNELLKHATDKGNQS